MAPVKSRSHIFNGSAAYLVVLAVIGPATIFVRAVFKGEVVIFGHTLGVAVPVILVAVAAMLWLLDRQKIVLNRPLVGLASLASFLWLFVMVRESDGQGSWPFSVFVLVPTLWMIASKPPSFRQARRATDVLILALALVAFVGTILAIAGYPLSNQFAPARPIMGFLPQLWDSRWVSVFETTTQASAVGAYLLIYGVWRKGRLFASLAAFGVLILLSGYSRGAFVATFAGLLILILSRPTIFRVRLTPFRRLWIFATVTVATVVGIFLTSPSMNGRTPILRAYLFELAPISPLMGLGTRQLDAIVAGDSQLSAIYGMVHAHNFLVDSLVRYGVIGFGLVLAIFLLALVVSLRAARSGLWVGLALVVTFFVNQLSDLHIDWLNLDYDYSVLIFAIVLAVTFQPSEKSISIDSR